VPNPGVSLSANAEKIMIKKEGGAKGKRFTRCCQGEGKSGWENPCAGEGKKRPIWVEGKNFSPNTPYHKNQKERGTWGKKTTSDPPSSEEECTKRRGGNIIHFNGEEGCGGDRCSRGR